MLKQKILQALSESSTYISGEDISKGLGVSRTAVWKAVSQLRQEGFAIDAVSNRGYILQSPVDCLDLDQVGNACGLVAKWELLDQVDSTNSHLKRQVSTGLPHGYLLVAEEQTAGRGRQGRLWMSARRQGLWFSILLRPQVAPNQAALLTLVAGLAVAEGLQSVIEEPVKIKWPNDVLLQGKKVCGILTEMVAEMEQINYLVLGLGVNVNQGAEVFENLPLAGSLASLTGRQWERTQILGAVLKALDQRYKQWARGDNQAIIDCWMEQAAYRNEEVAVSFMDGSRQTGVFHGVNLDGSMRLALEDGSQKNYFSGEVSLRKL